MKSISISGYFDILSQSQKAYGKQLEPVCKKWDLTRSELDVLLFLYNNPVYDRAADIVTHRGMAKSHVSISVTHLAELGLLERSFSTEDRRTVHLKLTEQGQIIAAEGKLAQRAFFEKLYSGVSREEFQTWELVTGKVCENIKNIDI